MPPPEEGIYEATNDCARSMRRGPADSNPCRLRLQQDFGKYLRDTCRRLCTRATLSVTDILGRRQRARTALPVTDILGRRQRTRTTLPVTDILGRRQRARTALPVTDTLGRRQRARATLPVTDTLGRRQRACTALPVTVAERCRCVTELSRERSLFTSAVRK